LTDGAVRPQAARLPGAERIIGSRPAGLALYGTAVWGYRRYRRTGQTPRIAYRAMRKLFGNSDASLFEALRARADSEHAPLDLPEPPPGIAEGFVDDAIDGLYRDGYVVLPSRLGEGDCADLEAIARQATCTIVPAPAGESRRRFDARDPVGVRYDLDEEDIVESAAAQRLIADGSLLAIAQGYLGTAPVQDLVAMWWSTAFGLSLIHI